MPGQELGWEHLPEIRYRRQTIPIVDDIVHLRRYVAAENVIFTIIDSVGLGCGGEPEKADASLRFYGAVRQLGCTALGVHHISKDQAGERGKRNPFGSIYHINVPRSHWEVRSVGEVESNVRNVAIYHRFVNNGPRFRPFGFELHFNENAIHLRRSDVMSVPELAAGTPLVEQIEAALRQQAMTVGALAEVLGAPESSIRVAFHRHKARFTRVGDKWGLIARTE